MVHTILLLAGRLAKAENARRNSTNESEAAILDRKVEALRKQHEEATELKNSIDRRGDKVRDGIALAEMVRNGRTRGALRRIESRTRGKMIMNLWSGIKEKQEPKR